MITSLVSRLVVVVFGKLYPAYASYKAIRNKNTRDYVKWMMYWIVFAFFTCIESCTDVFLSWFPFYHGWKILVLFWLVSPVTKGSWQLYRKIIHPELTRREEEIDECITQAKERGYSAIVQIGSKGVNYAREALLQTAIKTAQYGLIATQGQMEAPFKGVIRSRSRVAQDNPEHPIHVRSRSQDVINRDFREDELIQTPPYMSEMIKDELGMARVPELPPRTINVPPAGDTKGERGDEGDTEKQRKKII